MASMLESIQDLLTPDILSRVTRQTGESESAVIKGFGAVIPTIAGIIASRTGDRGFIKDTADLASATSAEPNAIASAAEMAFSTTSEGTMTATDNWLSTTFGRSLPGLADSVARYAGIRGSAAASLLSMGAPLVLTYLGRWMRRDHFGASRLAERLRDNQSEIADALPADFDLPAGLRGPFSSLGPAAEEAVPPAYLTPVTPARSTTSLNVPLMILLGVLGFGGLLWWGVEHAREHAQTTIGQGMSTLVGTTGTTDRMITRTLPGNVSVQFAPGGIEDALSSYLASPVKGSAAFEFNGISFESGSAMLTQPSGEQLHNVAAILNAYPKTSVTVEGYTDNSGDEANNLALSRAQAESVAGALTEDGVTAGRVRAEGFGSRKPIASNATEFGRSQNRRIMLDVVAR
jgi:outer membrane protein OmpA-like peptidoglycan-associated protein